MERLPTTSISNSKPEQSNSKFKLAPGEQLIVCPYDMSHQVTNLRLAIHLKKCRHNYENKMRDSGEALQIVACKFNWGHHVPLPELFHHERVCPDRYSVITHIMEFSNSYPAPLPSHLRQFSSVIYRSRGVPREDLETLSPAAACPDENQSEASSAIWPPSVASKDSNSRSSKASTNDLIPAWAKTIKKRELFAPITRSLKSFPTGKSIVVKAKTGDGVCNVLNVVDIDAAFKTTISSGPSVLGDKSNGALKKSQLLGDMGSICSSNYSTLTGSRCSSISTRISSTQKERQERVRARAYDEKGQDQRDYAWEFEPPVTPFNLATRFENGLSLKYPMGLNKSERKAWRNENVQKVRTLHGGSLLNVVPAPCPDPVANQGYLLNYNNSLFGSDTSDTSSSLDMSEATWEDEDWKTSEMSDTETDELDTCDMKDMGDFAYYFK